jgi:serine/threonine protein kinase
MAKINHPNVLTFTEKPCFLPEINTLVFKSEAPDHISSWKQLSKLKMSLFHTLSMSRQLISAVAHLNECGIVHRDIHPTRIHMQNGIVKFNMVGLPYNMRKLLSSPVLTGHLSYTSPELLSGRIDAL